MPSLDGIIHTRKYHDTMMAAENLFAMQQLNSSYNVDMLEGTCGEGKGDKTKETK